jgi:CRP-like cAMP-binding protein
MRLTREGGAAWVYEGRWVIGGVDALLDRPRNRTALALSHLRLLRVPGEGWLELIEDSFSLAQDILINVARSVTRLEDTYGPNEAVSHDVVLRVLDLPRDELNLVERLTLLMEFPMLRGAGVQTLADLAAVTDETTLDPGAVVLARGTTRDRVLFVIEGEVEAVSTNSSRPRRFGPGTLVLGAAAFGESSLQWEARAKTKVRLLSFRLEDWIDLMEENFDMVRSALSSFFLEQEQVRDRVAAETGEIVLR